MSLAEFNFTLGLSNPPPGTVYWYVQMVGAVSGRSYQQPVLSNWSGGDVRTAFLKFNDGFDDRDLLVRSDYPEGAVMFTSVKAFFLNSSQGLIGQINAGAIALACYGIYFLDAGSGAIQSFVTPVTEPYGKIILDSIPSKKSAGEQVYFIVRVKNGSLYDTPGQKYITVGCSCLAYPYTAWQALPLSPSMLEINRGNWAEFLGSFIMPDRDVYFYISSYGWRWSGSSGAWIRCEDHFHQAGVYVPAQFRNLQGVFS